MLEPAHTQVLVTGAAGFIAEHCILELLRAGYRVRGTVRGLSSADRVRKALAPHADLSGRFELVPLRELPGWIVRVAALFDKTLRLIVGDIDKRRDVSHARASYMLGWEPRALDESVVAMGESLIQYGIA